MPFYVFTFFLGVLISLMGNRDPEIVARDTETIEIWTANIGSFLSAYWPIILAVIIVLFTLSLLINFSKRY